jgi:predicted hydrocarbon binding protein
VIEEKRGKKEDTMNVIKRTIIKSLSKPSRPMMWHTFGMIGDVSKAFYEKNGKEALPTITEVANKRGAERAEIMGKMMRVKNMKDVGELFKMMDLTMDIGIEVIESSDKAFHFKLLKCVAGIDGTSRELCEALMATDKKMLSTLLGYEVEMKILQSIAAGDKNCEVIFSKK